MIQAQIKENITKLRVTGLCVGNAPVTGEFPAQMANNAENVSIWWHHHAILIVPKKSMHGRFLIKRVFFTEWKSHTIVREQAFLS